MHQFDDHTQDCESERGVWDAFAALHHGTCRLIRTQDHVYNRLLLAIPRDGYEVVFEASDKQCWHAIASGQAHRVEPFGISPRTLADDLIRVFHREEAVFEDPSLRQRLVLSGEGASTIKRILEGSGAADTLRSMGRFNLVLLGGKEAFTLRFVPDPIHSFPLAAEPALNLLDSLVSALRSAGAF